MKINQNSNSQKKKKLKDYACIKNGILKIYSSDLHKFIYYPVVERDKVDWTKWNKWGYPYTFYPTYYHPECKKCRGYGSDDYGDACANCDGLAWANFVTLK